VKSIAACEIFPEATNSAGLIISMSEFSNKKIIPVLELKELGCERDERLLFSGLNLSLYSGDIVQVGGPNGAGKTTLLRAIAGINTDFYGQLLYAGRSVNEVTWEFASDSLYLGHLPGIKKALTPAENLDWYRAQAGAAVSIDYALAAVGLSGYEDTPCYQLSAGQLRRVALARLHLSKARIWILDEPFTAIDKLGVSQLEALIALQSEQGGVVILTSHQDLTLPQLKVINLQDYQQPAGVFSKAAKDARYD
jgi:heme exporter protein A